MINLDITQLQTMKKEGNGIKASLLNEERAKV